MAKNYKTLVNELLVELNEPEVTTVASAVGKPKQVRKEILKHLVKLRETKGGHPSVRGWKGWRKNLHLKKLLETLTQELTNH